MDIQRIADSTIRIDVKKSLFVYNPTDKFKATDKLAAVLLPSGHTQETSLSARLIIAGAGEYEIDDVSIQGTAVPSNGVGATLYRVAVDTTSALILPAISPEAMTNQVLESVGLTSILILPVVNETAKFTPLEAAKLIRLTEPSVVIPVGYDDHSEELGKFLSEVGGTVHKDETSFKTKTLATMSEGLHVFLLN